MYAYLCRACYSMASNCPNKMIIIIYFWLTFCGQNQLSVYAIASTSVPRGVTSCAGEVSAERETRRANCSLRWLFCSSQECPTVKCTQKFWSRASSSKKPASICVTCVFANLEQNFFVHLGRAAFRRSINFSIFDLLIIDMHQMESKSPTMT